MLIVQFRAFDKGLTPYPRYAKWFNVLVGGIPTLLLGFLVEIIFPNASALGSAIGTMLLSVGNALTFGGLLAIMPSEEAFEKYRNKFRER